MSSYVIEKQSRGAGAVAAQDLGGVSHSCPPNQVWDRIEQFCRPRETKPVLLARTRTGAVVTVPFVQGRTGRALSPRRTIRAREFLTPVRSGQATASGTATSTKIVDTFVDRPVVPVSAGVMTGSLPGAVAAKNAAIDVFNEIEEDAAALQVPQIVAPEKKSNALVYGLGAAALLIYFMTRKP